MGSNILSVQAQINEQVRRTGQAFTLYWPGDDWAEVRGRRPMYDGIEYFIPPDGPGVDPRTGEAGEFDGTIKITDRWGVSVEKVKAVKERYGLDVEGAALATQRLVPDKVYNQANEIIAALISQLDKRGLVLLSGGPGDAALKEAARKRYHRWRFAVASDVVAQYRKQNADWRKNNPGVQPPPAPPKVQECQRYLDRHRAGIVGHKPYVCRYSDGFEYDTAEDLRLHYQGSHTAKAVTAAGEAAIEALDEALDAPAEIPPGAAGNGVVSRRSRRSRGPKKEG
jgi:hypothetical protein